MPLTFIPFLLLIVPISEIAVFVVIGGEIGALWTIGLVLLTAILGSILLRIEGIRTFVQIRNKLNAGQVPGEELTKGVMILIAGVLLLTPGFITDSIGFALFVPLVRKLIWIFLAERIVVKNINSHNSNGYYDSGNKDKNVVDLDPKEFHEDPNTHSPWYSGGDKNKTK
jgi:UPF0716 protein FxsA